MVSCNWIDFIHVFVIFCQIRSYFKSLYNTGRFFQRQVSQLASEHVNGFSGCIWMTERKSARKSLSNSTTSVYRLDLVPKLELYLLQSKRKQKKPKLILNGLLNSSRLSSFEMMFQHNVWIAPWRPLELTSFLGVWRCKFLLYLCLHITDILVLWRSGFEF